MVLRWSRARKRYERQGLLVEKAALEQAEAECLGDSDVRERKRARAEERRQETDLVFVAQFAAAVRALYPRCPAGRVTSRRCSSLTRRRRSHLPAMLRGVWALSDRNLRGRCFSRPTAISPAAA